MKKILSIIFKVLVYSFALVGFILTAGYAAVSLNLTEVSGIIDRHSDQYQAAAAAYGTSFAGLPAAAVTSTPSDLPLSEIDQQLASLGTASERLQYLKAKKIKELCKIEAIGQRAPVNAKNILAARRQDPSDWVFNQMVLAVSLRLESDQAFQSLLSACDQATAFHSDEEALRAQYENASSTNLFAWANGEQWPVVAKAILKDEATIKLAAQKLGVEPRLLVSILIVEQLRLYYTQREFYEKFFKPLSILANANKMAWGVMAIKEKAAVDIESHLSDPQSGFYLGPDNAHLLDFSTSDPAKERYERLTAKDHYYSYLYGATLIREAIEQWKKQGYDISRRPEILATLFNLGLDKSVPKAQPQVGGSTIDIYGQTYTFGSLAHEFYYSNLLPEFPYLQQ